MERRNHGSEHPPETPKRKKESGINPDASVKERPPHSENPSVSHDSSFRRTSKDERSEAALAEEIELQDALRVHLFGGAGPSGHRGAVREPI